MAITVSAGRGPGVAVTTPMHDMPLVASTDLENTGETQAQKVTRTLGYGYNGFVYYSGGSLNWNSTMAQMAIDHPGAFQLMVTVKSYVEADLRNILDNLPAAWKPGFRWNYYQEPEDNLTTAPQQQAYRDVYTAAAVVIRGYPGISLPWVEWAEYTTELNAGGDFSRNLANFTPPLADIGGVLWSFFEYAENISLSRLQTKVDRVKAAVDQYAPGKPWGLMASAYTLEPANGPFTDTQLRNQATWLTESFNRLKSAGSTGWGWYNVKFAGTGGAAGESRVEQDSYSLSALGAIKTANYQVPIV